MPSYLGFDETRVFRDFILGRTLQQPNGPQTFTSSNYVVQNLTDYANVDPGDVVVGSGSPAQGGRDQEIAQTKSINLYKPPNYELIENLETLPRRANLQLYPYFTYESHNLIGIMASSTSYDTESELFKFAAKYIKDDRNGPVHARIAQNTFAATVGRVRIEDALQGNTATAINILTGREPLIEANNKITVAKTIAGKAIDFMETVAGITLPFSTIPGDYLSNPANPVNFRPEARTEFGAVLQDVTGAVGSLFGIARRPKVSRKPSDLLIEYTGDGSKKTLYNLLSFSKYAPNYTTSARSQNSSKIFNFLDRAAQGVKNFLGVEAPEGIAYIGDDRGNDVKYAMGDFNDRLVKSPFYLTLLFDEEAARLFNTGKGINEGGAIPGKLTWISSKSKNKVGEHNSNWDQQKTRFDESLSTEFSFREDSILGYTQDLLNTLPDNGATSRTHVANAIDQTSRFFIDGDNRMSRGSNIKYVDKFTGEESGVEYCRVWTKDRPYYSMDDLMKKKTNIRKFGGSILTTPYNINIAPMSDGNKGFESSSNIFDKYQYGGGFFAKKYMFSIENLAWKTSNREGFNVASLPACEKGPNGGRVMWFPPYDLKVSESNAARWEENSFLGRPEPVFTYQNTTRTGTLSFKVVVDHPSVLNLLVREQFKGMSDEEADNYINAFFAGCKDVDLYDLVKRFTTLEPDDIKLIQAYLNEGADSETIKKYKSVTDPIPPQAPFVGPVQPSNIPTNSNGRSNNVNVLLHYLNNEPQIGFTDYISSRSYDQLYSDLNSQESSIEAQLTTDLQTLISLNTPNPSPNVRSDNKKVFPSETPDLSNPTNLINQVIKNNQDINNNLDLKFQELSNGLTKLKEDISGGTVQKVVINISSSTSILGSQTKNYNMKLSYRRSYSVIYYIIKEIENNGYIIGAGNLDTFRRNILKYEFSNITDTGSQQDFLSPEISFKEFGYNNVDGTIQFKVINYGENGCTNETSGGGSVGCNTGKFLAVPNLNITAPLSLSCRQTTVNFQYTAQDKQPVVTKVDPVVVPPPSVLPKTRLEEDGVVKVPKKNKKPPIDVMKRIIMKTLSECFYFKKLEETSPVAFSSLKEKLRYFHPGFHSTTPEGLNARLTFLHQCIRPGDTIPVKGKAEDIDIGARNTSFGPPPICVLRIGDFYHSKVVIRDLNISYEENVWDLNPEGIGVQPMIATVQLQLSFIGGQGLEKPIEKLQNALSSNFYANTEMYDERSISTNKLIDGIDAEQYTKQFLQDLLKNVPTNPTTPAGTKNGENIINGTFIGTLDGQSTDGTLSGRSLNYRPLVDALHENIEGYFIKYENTYNDINKVYGPDVTSLFFLSKYRQVYQYDVYENSGGSQVKTLPLLGTYKKGQELNVYTSSLKEKLLSHLRSIPNLTNDLLHIDINSNKFNKSDTYLRPWFEKTIGDIIDGMTTNESIKGLESIQDNIIKTLDKINFVVKYEHDGKIDKEKYTKVELSGFTSNLLYREVEKYVDYIDENHPRLTSRIDRPIDFNNINSITLNIAIEIFRDLLYTEDKTYEKQIEELYKADTTTFRSNVEIPRIKRAVDRFIRRPDKIKFRDLKRYPIKKDTKLSYGAINPTDITDQNEKNDLKSVFNENNYLGTKLNYYRR